METDEYFFYIEHDDGKCVVKLVKDYNWELKIIRGDEPFDFLYEYNIKNDMDDILDDLTDTFNYVREIESGDIEDYI